MPKAYFESEIEIFPFEHITYVSKSNHSILTVESSESYVLKDSDFPNFLREYREWLDAKEVKPSTPTTSFMGNGY